MSIKNNLIIKATANNKVKIVKKSLSLLKKLSNSFDIGQIRDKEGNTVLYHAAKNSNHEMVRLFIKYKIDVNSKNQHGKTPLTFVIKNFSVDEKNSSSTEDFYRRFSRGDGLLIIDFLLKAGTELSGAEYNLLQSIIEDQKNKNEYVFFCEKIEETLRERGYGNCDYNNNQEHVYENIDELRDDNVHMSRSDSVLGINSDDTWNWDNDKSEHQTLSNPQSDNKKGSRTPDSGYRSDNDPGQQDFKIVASSSRKSNTEKPSISPKPVNLQTRPQAPPAKKRPENKTSNPSFNKVYDSGFLSNQTSVNSIKERMKMFKNNTSSNFNRWCDSGFKSDVPSSKVSSGSTKKALNRSY